jgi:hypothetical protein
MSSTVPEKYVTLVNKAREVLSSERVTIHAYGDDEARRIFNIASSPHPKLRVVQTKSLGAALCRLPDDPNEVFKGRFFHEARRKRRRAMKSGFEFKIIQGRDHYEEILAINTSSPNRQNRPVEKMLSDADEVRDFCQRSDDLYGVFDKNGRLQAYAHGIMCGDVFVLDRMIGHERSLEFGIMYLLAYELLTVIVRYKIEHGHPRFIQHDMYWGVNQGLRKFKKDVGFLPHRAKWVWTDPDSQSS